MDKSVLLTLFLAIFSLGIIKKVDLLEEEVDETEALNAFQIESDDHGEKWNFPAKADYNITDKSQFFAIYGHILFNSTFIRSVEKIIVSEGARLDFLWNITFTDKFTKTIPTGSVWVIVEEDVLYKIEQDKVRSHRDGIDFDENVDKPNILVYVNGRYHRSRDFPWIIDAKILFLNNHNSFKWYDLHNLTFLPEGQKRSLVITMAMVTHYTIYNHYKDLQDDCLTETQISEKVTEKLTYDMLIIAKELKGIYKSLKLRDDELHINLVKTLVTRTPEEMSCMDEDRINHSTIDGHMASSFCRRELMAHENPLNIPKVEFLVVYTRDKIYFNSKIATGVVFAETMCVVNNLVIIYWEDVNSNAIMSAQKLALTLGIEFDGDFNDCDPDNKFVMSESLNEKWSKHSFNFSSCSGPYADEYIERMDQSGDFNCLDKHDGKKLIEQEDPSLPLPGLIHDLNEQCGIIHGTYSFYCGNKNIDQLEVNCKAIRCFYKSGCRSTPKFVLDGTSCANSSMCIRGKCVADERAPKVLTLPAFKRRKCKGRTRQISAAELVHEDRVLQTSDYDAFQEDVNDDSAEYYDFVNTEDYHDTDDNDEPLN